MSLEKQMKSGLVYCEYGHSSAQDRAYEQVIEFQRNHCKELMFDFNQDVYKRQDHKRYYYYAHLRKNYPYVKDLKVGSTVKPGDVIGYLGRTGYSSTENVNNIDEAHLHFGLQLIFDESQKEGNNEIWVDVYPLVRLLYRNRSETVKNQETKEYSRVYDIRFPGE